MNKELRTTCEDFIAKRDMLRENFKLEGSAMHLMGAALLSAYEDAPDAEALLSCEKTLKKHEGFFSPFRGTLKFPVIINMAMKDDPEEYLKMVRKAYDLICVTMGSRNEKYYLAAMEAAAAADSEDDIAVIVDERSDSYNERKDFDSMLASLDASDDEIADEIKEAEDFLGMQKGFGIMGTGAEMKRMYAEMLVCISRGMGADAGNLAAELAVDDALESRFRA